VRFAAAKVWWERQITAYLNLPQVLFPVSLLLRN
jgi:hypothetical protein